jgi:hypothetical protein
MTILAAPAILSIPSRFSLAPIANTQSGGRSPLDGTEQTLRQPGERWGAQLGFEGMSQAEWRPLLAWLAKLGGRAGRFTWSPPLPRRGTDPAGRRNEVPNSRFVGAGVGNPGTDWTLVAGSGGTTIAVSNSGVDAGNAWIEVSFSGTTTGGGIQAGGLEHVQVPAAVPGAVWTSAATLQVMGGSYAAVTAVRMSLKQYSGVSFAEWAVGTGTVAPLVAAATRRSVTATMGLTTTSCRLALDVRVTAGAAYSIVVRIHTPQLERGPTATAHIPTSGTPVTVLEGPYANGGPQYGSVIALRGFLGLAPAFLSGDLLSFVDGTGRPRLHIVTDDVTAALDGTCLVPIAPPLRTALADATVIEIASPAAIWRLGSDRNPMDIVRGLLAGGSLDIEEALA